MSEKIDSTQVNGNGSSSLDKESLKKQIEEALENEKEESVKFSGGIMDIPQETIDAFGGDELRARVFYEKYALRDKSGKIIENTPEDLWDRVAREISSTEKTKQLKEEWKEKFFWLLSDFKFIPGGRILFGAGQNMKTPIQTCS